MRKRIIFISMIFTALFLFSSNAMAADNIAYGKDTYASSKYTEDDSYAPEKVTNGSYNDIWSMGSVTLEGTSGGYQYVAVDLGGEYVIDSVKAVTRRGLDQPDARTGWVIQVANDRSFYDAVTIGTVDTPCAYQEDYTFISDYDTPFRYVRIGSKEYIVVAEIEVYGELYDPVTMKTRKEFIDTDGTDYAPAVSVLSYLGIMEGMSKNEFFGEALLTRAQAAKIITKFSNIAIKPAEDAFFEDVSWDHWAADYIYTAYENGIISADTQFRPGDYVTDKELLKMIMYSMNYGDYIEFKGGWQRGIYETADMLKLLKNVSVKPGEAISRANAAKILYNALLTPKCDKLTHSNGAYYYSQADENVLKEVFGLKITEGLMSKNSNTSLIREEEATRGYVKIGDKEYTDPASYAEFWIGRNIGILTDAEYDDEILAVWVLPKDNETVKIYDTDRVDVSDTAYRYTDENDKEKKISFDRNMYVIKNNSAVTDWTPDDLICPDGFIEFTDNNRDGKADVAFCYVPIVTALNYVSNAFGDISVVSLDGSVISVSDLNFTKMTKERKTTTAGKMKKNSIVKIYLSDNRKSLWIDANEGSISGTVEQVTGEGITIGGQETEFSEYFKNNRSKFDDISLSGPITVLTDDRGRMVWILKGSISVSGEVFGFVTSLRQGEDYTEEPAKIRIFSQYGVFDDYFFAPKVRIDGKSFDEYALGERISKNGLDIEGTFVMFTVNDDGLIDYLDTEYIGTEKNSKVVKMDVKFGSSQVNMSDAGGIYSNGFQLLPLKGETPSFTIPWVGDTYGQRDYERYYQVRNAEGTFPRLVQITEKTAFYGADESGYPAFAVKFKPYSAQDGSGVLEITDENAPGIIVTGITNSINDDYETVYIIKGYELSSGKEMEYVTAPGLDNVYLSDKIQHEQKWTNDYKFIDPSKIDQSKLPEYIMPMASVKKGDIIRLQVEGDVATAAERVFEANSGLRGRYDDISDGNWYSAGKTYPTYPTAAFRLVYGVAKEINDDVFIMETCKKDGIMRTQNVLYKNLPNIFVVSGSKIEKDSGQNLPSNVSMGSEVLLYTKGGPSAAVIVYR